MSLSLDLEVERVAV